MAKLVTNSRSALRDAPNKKEGIIWDFFPSVPNVPADMFRLGSPGFEGLGVEVWPRGLCVLWVVLYCVWCTVLESLCGGVGCGGLCVMVWWVVWLNQSTYCVVWWVVWCQKPLLCGVVGCVVGCVVPKGR